MKGGFFKRIRWGFHQNVSPDVSTNRQYDLENRFVVNNPRQYLQRCRNIPTLYTKMFACLPPELKDYLFVLMETGQRAVRQYWGNSSIGCKARNNAFSRQLNAALGRPELLSNFEYCDLLVMKTNQTTLARHVDYKNDWRQNYNHCFVYSFSRDLNGERYKASFVMTTRNHVGAAMDDVHEHARPAKTRST